MPSPKVKRIIVIQSSYSSTDVVANLNLTMNASFTTPSTILTSNTLEDASTSSDESSEWSMVFSTAAGPVGEIVLTFIGLGDDLASGVQVAKTSSTTTTLPRAVASTVTPIATPDAYYSRVWQQPALSGATELVDQVGALGIQVKAESGFTVSQTVTSTDDDELILTYAWSSPAGPLVSGTVRLEAASAALGSYTLGDVTVTDDPPSLSFKAGESRKDLRARLKAMARELREARKAARKDRKDKDKDKDR